MLPYISQKFTPHEKEYYWEQCREDNTFCRIAVVLKGKDGFEVLSKENSEPKGGKHAEIVALEYIVNELESQAPVIEAGSVLDVIIRINNSPCSDCQDILPGLLMEIKEIAPKSQFRLIIFYSNLYQKKRIEEFSEWILYLVEEGVVVILCPLFVTTMVPMPYKISTTDKIDRADLDQDCIDDFRELLTKIEEYEGSFSMRTSHDLFEESYPVFKWLFSWKNPHFIAISPRNVSKRLSKLFIDPEFFISNHIKKQLRDFKTRKRPSQPQNSELVKGISGQLPEKRQKLNPLK